MSRFTWIPLYEELASKLLNWEHRQTELVSFLEQLRRDGLVVTPMNDRSSAGEQFLVREIDPFTFFGTFNRGVTTDNRIAILAACRTKFDAKAPVPSDFTGIPILNNQRSWFFRYAADRGSDDVAKFWRVFRIALRDDPLSAPEFIVALDKALKLWGVSFNLTMALFWIRPRTFLNLDSRMRGYLNIEIPSDGLTGQFYVETLARLRAQGLDFAQSSAAAYESGLPPVDETAQLASHRYWKIAPGSDAENWQQCVDGHYIALGWTKIGNLVKGTRQEFENLRARAMSEDSRYTEPGCEQLWRFRGLRPGDRVIANRGTAEIVGVGVVTGTYYYADGTYPHRIPVDWIDTQPKEVDQPGWRRTVIELTKEKFEALVNLRGHERTVGLAPRAAETAVGAGEPEAPTYSLEEANRDLYLEPDSVARILRLLQRKSNVVLQGPPGVGKTFVAERIAYATLRAKDPARLHFIQFHQSYSYEDFIEGYRPAINGGFVLTPGRFREFVKRASSDPSRRFVMVIDEINRGNLSKIFGELMVAIEHDKRGPEHAVRLAYSGESFFVPRNLFIIGMMNTADRSLAVVDYALRRRFAFVDLVPAFENARFREQLEERTSPEVAAAICDRLSSLNAKIAQDKSRLGPGFCIGHSYFCAPRQPDQEPGEWYGEIVESELEPLLREYYFDDPERASDYCRQLRLS